MCQSQEGFFPLKWLHHLFKVMIWKVVDYFHVNYKKTSWKTLPDLPHNYLVTSDK